MSAPASDTERHDTGEGAADSPSEPARAQPKENPEALVLRGAPRRVARFRREIIIGVAATGALAIAAVTWIALEPASFKLAASGEEMFEKGEGKPPEALAGTPGRYDEIPKLGPPLPGDLGRPILEHQRRMESEYPPVTSPADRAAAMEAERDRRLAEEAAARQSAVMMSLGPNRRTEASAGRAGSEALAGERKAGEPPASTPSVAANRGGANVSPHRIEAAASPWLVTSGSVIAASLVTGLNSDLPGLVVAQVSEMSSTASPGVRFSFRRVPG